MHISNVLYVRFKTHKTPNRAAKLLKIIDICKRFHEKINFLRGRMEDLLKTTLTTLPLGNNSPQRHGLYYTTF